MSGGGNAARLRGRSRELDVMDVKRAEGWIAYRLAWGCADVIALREGERPRLIQVKSTIKPYAHFIPRERDALKREAIAAGADCELAWWPKHGRLTIIPSDDWPPSTHEQAAA